MFYIYKTTFLKTGEFYIGYHFSHDITKDDYIGSGTRIVNLKKKYPRECFLREILFKFGELEEARDKEREIVNEQFLLNPLVLNLVIGGNGGAGTASFLTQKQRKENGMKAAEKLRGRSKHTHLYLEEAGKKISNRFAQWTPEERRRHGEKSSKWMNNLEKLNYAKEKQTARKIGKTKQNADWRLAQSEKVSGAGNGAAKTATHRRRFITEHILHTAPKEVFSPHYDINKQRAAIGSLVEGIFSTQRIAAKSIEMPISSFNVVVSKLITFASNSKKFD